LPDEQQDATRAREIRTFSAIFPAIFSVHFYFMQSTRCYYETQVRRVTRRANTEQIRESAYEKRVNRAYPKNVQLAVPFQIGRDDINGTGRGRGDTVSTFFMASSKHRQRVRTLRVPTRIIFAARPRDKFILFPPFYTSSDQRCRRVQIKRRI